LFVAAPVKNTIHGKWCATQNAFAIKNFANFRCMCGHTEKCRLAQKNGRLSVYRFLNGGMCQCIERGESSGSKESMVAKHPAVKLPNNILASVVEVAGTKLANYGIYCDFGTITTTHTVAGGGCQINGVFSKADKTYRLKEVYRQSKEHHDLIVIPGKVNNVVALTLKQLEDLVEPRLGTVFHPSNSGVGMMTQGNGEEPTIVIQTTTEKGWCGLPYCSNGKVNGIHNLGHSNGVDNGGIRFSPAILKWFGTLPKN
jgi:hypothetical protein